MFQKGNFAEISFGFHKKKLSVNSSLKKQFLSRCEENVNNKEHFPFAKKHLYSGKFIKLPVKKLFLKVEGLT